MHMSIFYTHVYTQVHNNPGPGPCITSASINRIDEIDAPSTTWRSMYLGTYMSCTVTVEVTLTKTSSVICYDVCITSMV